MSSIGDKWKELSILDNPVPHYRNVHVVKKKTRRNIGPGFKSAPAYGKKWVHHKKIPDNESLISSASGFLSYRSWTKTSHASSLTGKLRIFNPENVVVRLISPTSIRVSWRPPENYGSEISRYVIDVMTEDGEKIGQHITEVDNPVKNHYTYEIENLPSEAKLSVNIKAKRKGYYSDSVQREISTYEENIADRNHMRRKIETSDGERGIVSPMPYHIGDKTRGFALIIVNLNNPAGEEDADYMKSLFKDHLNFKVATHLNLEAAKMKSAVQHYAEQESYHDIFVCVFACSGNLGVLYGSDGKRSVPIEDLLRPLSESRGLQDKPKIVLIDACQGVEEHFEIHATPLAPHSIKLSWSQHKVGEGDEVRYIVYYRVSGGGERFEEITEHNSLILRDLQDNTAYRIIVVPLWKFRSLSGKWKEVKGAPSQEIECSTFEKDSFQPRHINAVSMNPYSIDVSWIGPKYFENIKNYIIFFRGSRITVSPSPDTLNYFTQLHHLLPDTEYKLKVVAVLKNGQRDEVELFAHTKKKENMQPKQIDCFVISPTQVCVRWKPPDGKHKHLLTKYKVRWGESARYYKEIDTEYASCILRDLNVNTEYTIQVNVVTKKGKFDIPIEVKEPARTTIRTSTPGSTYIPKEPDFLIGISTIPRFGSYLDQEKGSKYLSAIKHHFEDNPRLVRRDITTVLQEANTMVNTDDNTTVRQVALLYSTLTGPIYFNS
ncbi:COL12A [Mytilus coruscus]|uniref:COL12A n=1 Tax=Mytilus coruscus TaxID=42192 RepID=A0A6J8BKB8_MYTCO|nr:COL12A [Mytilus coruscus]